MMRIMINSIKSSRAGGRFGFLDPNSTKNVTVKLSLTSTTVRRWTGTSCHLILSICPLPLFFLLVVSTVFQDGNLFVLWVFLSTFVHWENRYNVNDPFGPIVIVTVSHGEPRTVYRYLKRTAVGRGRVSSWKFWSPSTSVLKKTYGSTHWGVAVDIEWREFKTDVTSLFRILLCFNSYFWYSLGIRYPVRGRFLFVCCFFVNVFLKIFLRYNGYYYHNVNLTSYGGKTKWCMLWVLINYPDISQ